MKDYTNIKTTAQKLLPIMAGLIENNQIEKMIGLTIEQDWENERTIYRFKDNSAIIDCNGILTIEQGVTA